MDILSTLKSKPHNNHYLMRYFKFINYYASNIVEMGEIHHICPKSVDLFPEYKSLKLHEWNKVKLPHRAHFIAHWMLHKAYGGRQTFAYISMCNQLSPEKVKVKREKPNSRFYASARIEVNKLISICNSGPKPNLSKHTKGKVACKDVDGNGLRVTQEEFDLNENLVGVCFGKKYDDSHMKTTEHRKRTSDTMTGRIHIINKISEDRKFVKPSELNYYLSNGYTLLVLTAYDRNQYQKTCEHCNKTLDSSNYAKWHGNKCKLSPTNINPLFE